MHLSHLMQTCLRSVNLKPDGWLWYFPQYHIIIFLLVLVAIALLIITVRRAKKNSAKLDMLIAHFAPTVCPCCQEKTMVTVRECISPKCRSITVLKEKRFASGD